MSNKETDPAILAQLPAASTGTAMAWCATSSLPTAPNTSPMLAGRTG